MPKVETSLIQRGEFSNFNVSNTIGNNMLVNNLKLSPKIKRDLSRISDTETATPGSGKSRRVLKKLVRVEPLTYRTPDDSLVDDLPEINTQPSKVDVTPRRIRKRLKIKKKRKLIVNNAEVNNTDTYFDPEERIQQATKPRRKIIITRKRILPNISKTEGTGSVSTISLPTIKNSAIQSSAVETYSSSIEHESYDHNHFSTDDGDYNELEGNYDENEDVDFNDDDDKDDDDEEAENYDDEEENNYDDEEEYNYDDEDEESYEDEDDTSDGNHITKFPDDIHDAQENNSLKGTNDNDIERNDFEPDEVGNAAYPETFNKNPIEAESVQKSAENLLQDNDNSDNSSPPDAPTFQDIPEYEPSFPELTESLDAPVLLLKTTVLSSTEFLTRTVIQSRLRTYTFVITRVSGNEQIITSTTEVKPQIKTSILTEPHIKFTTLTLLDFDATKTLTDSENTIIPTLENSQTQLLNQQDNGSRNFNEEARYNLATRVMSNGVEVIVAGDKKTLPGESDFKRLLPSGIQKPVTLKPSTLTDHMVMMLPQEDSNIESLTSSLYPNQFVTKTCLTTFTYLTTYLQGSTTTVSSHEQVVSNVATEERNTGKILPTPAMGVTLTQFPNLSVGVFHTTYTYLNTILDGEQPLVISSKHTVTNTVTAPDDYLSPFKTSESASVMKDTNTYYSTIGLEKTLYEGDQTSVISTREVVTQVVITESIPPQATSVMTSYIALDMEEDPSSISSYITTDVVKTYFVTYTYYNTVTENGIEAVQKKISTSTDIVTEQLYLMPKKSSTVVMNTAPSNENNKNKKIDAMKENLEILATKSYFTTFTYFTTLLQEENKETPIIISSRTRVIENLVTEVVDPQNLAATNLDAIKNSINEGHSTIVTVATLQDGQKLEITAFAAESEQIIAPTKTLPIEKTESPDIMMGSETPVIESSSPSIITGSTIVFFDDDPFAQLAATPILKTTSKLQTLDVKNSLDSSLISEIIEGTKLSADTNKSKRSTKSKSKIHADMMSPTKTKVPTNKNKQSSYINPSKTDRETSKQALPATKIGKPQSDLLGLGSININSLQALTPVLNAMAGLISTNLKTNRRNDVNITTPSRKPITIREADSDVNSPYDVQNRSPIYIPVGGLSDDFEIAESQNIANFEWVDLPSKDRFSATTPHETSLLNGGIPISPGEIITANSDVIVGKPGRIGPRIPSIPLHQVTADNGVPVGMKPPPVPNNSWQYKRQEHRHIPVSNIKRNKPHVNVEHTLNKDDYIGPPPPLHGKKPSPPDDRENFLQPPRGTTGSGSGYGMKFNRNEIPLNHQVYAQGQKNYDSYEHNEVNHEHQYQNLQETIQQNYNSLPEQSYPQYAQDHSALRFGTPLNDLNIKSSVINEPIMLPEVIERSTGQPLLVNIQPSQVAFVSIPYNRTTALIYGGSTEPHKNGQYFDDPSPYPEPEFSGIDFDNGIPHIASIYQGERIDQKQVNGFIKVENQLINIDPATSENQNVPVNIKPTRPQVYREDHVGVGNNHEINLNVPPISFGLTHQDDDFNAHIINHGTQNIQQNLQITKPLKNIPFKPPPNGVDYNNRFPYVNDAEKQKVHSADHGIDINGNILGYANHNNKQSNDIPGESIVRRPEISTNKQEGIKAHDINKFPHIPKRNSLRPTRPRIETQNLELAQYMIPPPFIPNAKTERPNYRKPPNKRLPPIPTGSNNQQRPQKNPNYTNSYNTVQYNPQKNEILDASPEYDAQNNQPQTSMSYSNNDFEVGYHKDDDLENEDGEVVQESNSRPLLPGEVPTEILRAQQKPHINRNNTIRFPDHKHVPDYNDKIYGQVPINTQKPRPFQISKPEDQRPVFNADFESGIQKKPFDSNFVSFNRDSSTEKNNDGPTLRTPENNSNRISGNQLHHQIIVGSVQSTDGNNRNEIPVVGFGNGSASTGIKSHTGANKSQSVFGSKIQHFKPTNYPTSTASSTQKPILIFIDEKAGTNKKDFFHHPNQKQNEGEMNMRPSVTSLPIDTHTFDNKESHFNHVHNTQTEKGFVVQNNVPSSNGIIIDSGITTEVTQLTLHDDLVTSDLNTGEITSQEKPATVLSDMEILKPPPTSKPLDTEIHPPVLSTNDPNIHNDGMININTYSSSTKPYIPNVFEELVPPPVHAVNEEVLGMSPPPLISNIPQKTTNEPVVSMQIDTPKKQTVSKPSTTTERYKFTRTRRPYTRRPVYRFTTTPSSTTTTKRKPTYPYYNLNNLKNQTTKSPVHSKAESNTINPSPTLRIKPTMEVIIGQPSLDFEGSESSDAKYVENTESGVHVELSASETSMNTPVTEKTTTFITEDLFAVESGIPIREFEMHSDLGTTTDIITKGVHHAGNEVKVIDDPTPALPSKKSPTTTIGIKPLLPTKYITHTKTATVTITKTTVVKSHGMSPSTLTILVTTTEKSTIIDTVTEVHTLVKPTSIIETVTTTVQQGSSLYPPDVYGTPYPSIQVKPTIVSSIQSTPASIFEGSFDDDDDLEDFIIHETDPPITDQKEEQPVDNDSILVIMTDKNTKNIIPVPNNSYEIQERDEMIATNKVNNVLLGGILIANNPVEKKKKVTDKCDPECQPSRNELCQKLEGVMRCVCRPGFARMFPDRPCLPTYTYELNITLDRIGKDPLHFYDDLRDSNSTEFHKFAQATSEGLNRMVMQSDLRDVFHGVKVHSFEPGHVTRGIVSKFYLQLSDNIEEERLVDIFHKYLRNNSYSLGGTDIFGSPLDVIRVQDFDECSFASFHDCSENAQCFNLRGTYTCSCKEGYSDLSENIVYPGRICSAEQVGCERCSYHGTCYSRGANEVLCECFQWYTGDSCQINLKVLLIALATMGITLFILLLICIFSACMKRKPQNTGLSSGMRFMPQRVANSGNGNTLDRRAMIQDTSSEDSRSETNETLPYIQEQNKKPKTALKKSSKSSTQLSEQIENGDNSVSFMDQKDRSLTVMIPRAKYHPASATSPLMNYTTFDARKPSVPPTVHETKLLSYLDAGPSPNNPETARKLSKAPSDSTIIEDKAGARKTSGALISAGFEVSATVVNNMGTLGTTCGTEADRSENATLIQRISTDLLSSTGTRSQFNTLRKSLVDENLGSDTNWLDMVPRVMTVSEARSYDETTIPPPVKSFRSDSKVSSQHQNDEANTMAERDLGSTFLLPHTHLYNPDRGSDISGFESL